MLLNNRVELKGSLLQFKNKVSFILNYYILDPPTKLSKKKLLKIRSHIFPKYHQKYNYIHGIRKMTEFTIKISIIIYYN